MMIKKNRKNIIGRQLTKGMYFKSKDNIRYSSDINGALNLLRKVVPTFSVRDYGIEGVVVYPVKYNISFN